MKYKLILAGLLIIAALGSGCGTRFTPTPTFDQATLTQLDALLISNRISASSEGMIMMISVPGRGEYLGLDGTGEVATAAPIDPNKLFRIGSITKTITTTVALQLVDEGLISLDDKVSTYITGVPSGDSITLRMLFNHTSGLPNYSNSLAFITDLIADRHRQFTPQELLNYGWAMPMAFAPGTAYGYSNTNTVLLGMIIELKNREGETLGQAMKRRVFDKIGLQNTSFPTGESFPGEYTHGYAPTLTPGVLDDWSIQNLSWGWAAGAAISNAYDLRTYIKALYTNSAGLLSSALQNKRINEDWVAKDTTYLTAKCGLGWMQLGGFFYHEGVCPGYNALTAYDPSTDTTIVVMLNTKAPDAYSCEVVLFKLIPILFPGRAI